MRSTGRFLRFKSIIGELKILKFVNKDILVIGSGLAGLSAALRLPKKLKIGIITKSETKESSTYYAQGGIAAVNSMEDTFFSHVQDTLIAGDGLCKKKVVETVINTGPSLIQDLINWGVDFTRFEHDENMYDLTKEGGHTNRRIFHKDDITGKEIETKLVQNIKQQDNVEIFEQYMAVNLIIFKQAGKICCCGAYVLNQRTGQVMTFKAGVVILASGGAGKVYIYTSNPDISSGDGIAIAYRAGAAISNMEFMQFHPTCLYHPKAKSFLISEALRGEGAKLRLPDGSEFMHNYHQLKELAPRDIVARAIDFEIKKRGISCVYLDISFRESSYIKKRFPNIYKKCLEFGIDITKNPIPVVPAAHYTCGGVKTDINGRTNIKNLFAIGEVACTGLHGANRLASNSLLEAIFFAKSATDFIKESYTKSILGDVAAWDSGKAVDSHELIMIQHNWEEIRRLMWNYVGIVRSDKRLSRANRRINVLIKEIHEYYWDFTVTTPLLELRNLADVAKVIVKSAMQRNESRGLHYSLDYPSKLEKSKDTLVYQRK